MARKKKKLEMAVALIHRRFGQRSLVQGRLPTAVVPHIPTGFPALDQALGIGGLPQGRVSELLGLATSGKTTLALKFLAQAQAVRQGFAQQQAVRQGFAQQQAGGQVGYIDQARYFDADYAHRCGLDLSRLVIGSPYDFHEALAMTEALARDGGLAALVFDTLDVFWTDPEAARHLAALLNRLAAPLSRSGTVLLFLHDAVSNRSPALSALAHTASVRLQITRERWLRQHGDVRGYEARVEVLKNRLGPAGQAVPLKIRFNGTVHGNGL